MSKMILPLPTNVTEDLLLECAVLWEGNDHFAAVRKWANATGLTSGLALRSLKTYMRQYELVELLAD